MPCLSTFHIVILFAAMGGFLFGYDTSVINAAMFQMKDHFGFDLESWEAGLIVSIAIVGAFLGSLGAGMGATAFGRRKAIAVADVLFIAGSALLAGAPAMWALMVGRFIIGLGIGVASVMIPVYLAEITPAETRGSVITMNNAFITGGQFIAAGIGGILIYVTGDALGWRLMFAIGALSALVQLLGIAALPESPRWLVLHGRAEEAAAVAQSLGIDFSAASAIDEANNTNSNAGRPLESALATAPSSTLNIADKHTVDRSSVPTAATAVEGSASGAKKEFSTLDNFKLIFGKRLRRRLLVGAGLQLFQQLSGINTIMYYSSTILKKAGFGGDKDAVLLSIPLAFTNGLFTFVGMVVIERWGRRPLLVRSLVGCALATAGMTAVGFLLDGKAASDTACGWSFMGLLVMYLAFFAPGMGPVPWVVNAEIYPNNLRSDAASVATMVNWASNALVSQLFPMMLGAVGAGPTFAAVTGLVLLAIAFVGLWVPETRNVPLEEMGELFSDNSSGEERSPLMAGRESTV